MVTTCCHASACCSYTHARPLQDAASLGIGGAVIRCGIPWNLKLLLVAFIQFCLTPLLTSQLFLHRQEGRAASQRGGARQQGERSFKSSSNPPPSHPHPCSYAYSTVLLALWLARHVRPAGACAAMTVALLAVYAAPLAALYRRELEERTAFAAHLLTAGSPQGNGRATLVTEGREVTAGQLRIGRLRAYVDAELFAPASFLVPAAAAACCACL